MPESKSESPEHRGLNYALNDLQVNEVYEQAKTLRNDLDAVLTDLSNTRDKLRVVEAAIEDREQDIVIEETGKHPDHSQAALDRHIKATKHMDPQLRELRKQAMELRMSVDGLEIDKTMAETDIRIVTARMTELGGLLQFMSALKAAQMSRKKGGETNANTGTVGVWDT